MSRLRDGKLLPPPRSPNCVSSQADPADRTHHVPGLRYAGPPDAALARLRELILAMPRVALVHADATSLHFTFTTRIMRYVDDVDVLIDPASDRIDLRSASRVGYGDFNANRKRVEAIRAAWEAAARNPT